MTSRQKKTASLGTAESRDDDEQMRLHTAHLMSEYLLSLSQVCRRNEWHRTGMHLYTAGEELKKMLHRNTMTQKRYVKRP